MKTEKNRKKNKNKKKWEKNKKNCSAFHVDLHSETTEQF
jgi:hypothetical protein